MKFGVVNKSTIRDRSVLHTLQRNITRLVVITRKTNIKLGILKGGNWKRAWKSKWVRRKKHEYSVIFWNLTKTLKPDCYQCWFALQDISEKVNTLNDSDNFYLQNENAKLVVSGKALIFWIGFYLLSNSCLNKFSPKKSSLARMLFGFFRLFFCAKQLIPNIKSCNESSVLQTRRQVFPFWTSSKTSSQIPVDTRSIETRRYKSKIRIGIRLRSCTNLSGRK